MFKKILAVIAVILLGGGSIYAFAYWDELEQTTNETIALGAGVTLTVDAVAIVPAGKFLVPEIAILKANDIKEIVLTYNVRLDLSVVTALDLAVVASNVLINGSAVNAALVNIGIVQAFTTVNAADVLVTVTITLTEPATFAIYELIRNQPITFSLTFTATEPL